MSASWRRSVIASWASLSLLATALVWPTNRRVAPALLNPKPLRDAEVRYDRAENNRKQALRTARENVEKIARDAERDFAAESQHVADRMVSVEFALSVSWAEVEALVGRDPAAVERAINGAISNRSREIAINRARGLLAVVRNPGEMHVEIDLRNAEIAKVSSQQLSRQIIARFPPVLEDVLKRSGTSIATIAWDQLGPHLVAKLSFPGDIVGVVTVIYKLYRVGVDAQAALKQAISTIVRTENIAALNQAVQIAEQAINRSDQRSQQSNCAALWTAYDASPIPGLSAEITGRCPRR